MSASATVETRPADPKTTYSQTEIDDLNNRTGVQLDRLRAADRFDTLRGWIAETFNAPQLTTKTPAAEVQKRIEALTRVEKWELTATPVRPERNVAEINDRRDKLVAALTAAGWMDFVDGWCGDELRGEPLTNQSSPNAIDRRRKAISIISGWDLNRPTPKHRNGRPIEAAVAAEIPSDSLRELQVETAALVGEHAELLALMTADQRGWLTAEITDDLTADQRKAAKAALNYPLWVLKRMREAIELEERRLVTLAKFDEPPTLSLLHEPVPALPSDVMVQRIQIALNRCDVVLRCEVLYERLENGQFMSLSSETQRLVRSPWPFTEQTSPDRCLRMLVPVEKLIGTGTAVTGKTARKGGRSAANGRRRAEQNRQAAQNSGSGRKNKNN